ncbi:unnamed protein product [Caenorhabditis bovis]|uniref:DUF4440 domain-containing protein n=1 Tax=Caenorhabditis bovis TaxID=2654633 RepID=A0A8S1F224_9PELO|nr:unnamed protein product [Caenorhabditis bovis]
MCKCAKQGEQLDCRISAIAEFQRYHDEIEALIKSKNFDEYVRRFTANDCVLLGPFDAPKSAQEWAELMKADSSESTDIRISVDDVKQIGDIVVDRVSYEVRSETGALAGWILNVWVQEDGAWKIRNACTTIKCESE